MSVLGIDLGNESGVIAQALRGGVDIILNEGETIAFLLRVGGHTG